MNFIELEIGQKKKKTAEDKQNFVDPVPSPRHIISIILISVYYNSILVFKVLNVIINQLITFS